MQETQTIDELRERYSRLSQEQAKAATELALAEQALGIAKDQARAAYGTDDLEELKQKLREWEEENETKRQEYQQSLDDIEAELEKVRQAEEKPA